MCSKDCKEKRLKGKMSRYIVLGFLFCVTSVSTNYAQLSGDYYIDQTASGSSLFSNGGSYFNTFNEVFDELWAQGVNGAVIVHVTGGQTFNENLQIDATFTGASAINTVEFKYEGSNKPVLQPDQPGFGELVGVIDIRFDGDYYLTFNGIKINATNGPLTYRRGVRIIWGADHVTIKNCEIVDFDANGIAVYFGGGSGGANNGCVNNVIENNEIYHESLSSTAFEVAGIWITGGVDTDVRGNYVHDLLEGSGTLTGIYSSGSADTTDVAIYNNFVAIGNSITSDIRIYGIYTQHTGGSTVDVYFNSIRLGGTVDNASDFTAAMRFTNTGTTEVDNNIISNFRANNSGTGTHYSVYLATGSATYAGDHNDLYTPQSPLAYRIGDVTDLTTWQSNTGQDANSISSDPLFVSTDDLHVQETSLTADAGVRIPGISVDIDGEPRDFFNPDIGADEFSGDTSLPVELASFEASVVNNEVLLEWVTESEVNNHGFEIWKSEEEKGDYHLIASYKDERALEGQGNSPVRHVYEFIDPNVVSGQTYYYQLTDVDFTGVKSFHDPISVFIDRSDAGNDPQQLSGIPTKYNLRQNYPNPFNPSTIINYELRITNNVDLSIYTVLGTKVKTLVSGEQQAGSYAVKWDATGFASGVYFYILEAGEFRDMKKMILLQ
jgi:hypothetical protein